MHVTGLVAHQTAVDGEVVRPGPPSWSRLERLDRRPVDRGVLRLEGEYWTIVYDGTVVRLRDTVGLRHLAQLLWHPQRDFPAVDLMRAVALAGASRAGRPPAGTEGPAADTRAAFAYRRRLRDLDDELTDADGRADLGRSASLRAERDALHRELRDGGRVERLGRDVERARLAVTKALKAALDRVRAAHPALAAHLDASVKRGYVCVYRPDPRCPIQWDC
jgi:hypothetical protein